MSSQPPIPTSKTLLRQLVDSSNRDAWNQAWGRFVQLYGPAIQAWGRRFNLQHTDGENLVQRVAIKLLKSMTHWETRRWLRSILERALGSVLTDNGEKSSDRGTQPRKISWGEDAVRGLMDELTKEEFARITVLQEKLATPVNPSSWSDSWATFEKLFAVAISRYLLKRGTEGGEAEQSARQLLTEIAQAMHDITDADLPRFRSWLYVVVRNAAADCIEELRREGYQLTEDDQRAKQDFVKELEQRELLHEAEGRVEPNQKSDHWAVYRRMVHDRRTGEEVAAEFGLTVANVYKIVSRVKRQVRQELEELDASVLGEST